MTFRESKSVKMVCGATAVVILGMRIVLRTQLYIALFFKRGVWYKRSCCSILVREFRLGSDMQAAIYQGFNGFI